MVYSGTRNPLGCVYLRYTTTARRERGRWPYEALSGVTRDTPHPHQLGGWGFGGSGVASVCVEVIVCVVVCVALGVAVGASVGLGVDGTAEGGVDSEDRMTSITRSGFESGFFVELQAASWRNAAARINVVAPIQ